jgi:uncharacterized protein involved in outer membrane biogenesis
MKIRLPERVPYPRALAAAAAVFVLYLLLGFLLAPRLIERSIPSFVADQLQRKATVGAVRVNPLLLSLEISDFALTERSGAPIAGFKRLLVDFQLSSLPRWAWTFSEVTLEGLDVKADIAPDGRFNLGALLEDLSKDSRSDAKAPRVLLQRVVMRDGAIAVSDRSDPTPASTRLGPINFELHDISTLQDRRGTYVVNARLADGGDIAWRGEVSLQPIASQGEISVKGVKPLTAWRFLQDETRLAEPKGEVDFSARYRVAYAGGVPQATIEDLRYAGRDIALTLAGEKKPTLALAAFEVSGGRFDLSTRELVIPAIEVRNGSLVVEVDSSGNLNWQKLVKTGGGNKAAEPAAAAPGKPWKVKVESLRVAGVGLDYTDRSRSKPIRLAAQDVTAGVAATLETGPGGVQVLLEGIALTLKRLSAGEAAPAEPIVVLDAVTLEGGSLDLRENRLGIGRIAVNGGSARVTREKDGAVLLADLFSRGDAGLLRREAAGALKQAKAEGHPWRVTLDALEVAGTRISLADHSFGAPVEYDVQDLRARINGFRSDGKDPIRFDAAMRLAQGGALSASGAFKLSGEQAEGRVKLERINLKPLHPAIASRTRAVLASGELSGDVKAQYRLRGERHVIRASGPVSIDNLLINEADSGDRLLAWKSLSTDSVLLSLDPDELRIGEVRIAGLGAKIVVFKDRSVNLVKAVAPGTGQAAGAAEPAPAAPAGTVTPVPPAPPANLADTEPLLLVNIGRVSVENGAVEFADLSLALPFAANVRELGGVVQGVSTDRDSRASVRLEGRVDEFGLARVEGSLRPFRPKSFLDLSVTFRNVEMPTLSPYTVTFAGRRIASGRLALDLRYKIENSQLAGDNRIVLEKFTLGERVETPGALSLPLDLAVALLTDSQGRIDLTVPVSGNVDDPQFAYGHLVWQAIVNVLTRIVTAPFRALGALFGGSGAENLESIVFDPGRATLLPPEREKLKRVAEGVAKRPQLRLVAEGQYGSADLAALRQRDVEMAVSARLRRPTAADALTEPVNVTEGRTQRALEAIFVERQSEQALEQFAAETGKSRGKPVERVNAALALVGRGSADREFYEALLKRLNDTARLPDNAPRQLADARAHAVMGYLTGELSVPAEGVAARVAAEPGEVRVRMTFDVAGTAAAR